MRAKSAALARPHERSPDSSDSSSGEGRRDAVPVWMVVVALLVVSVGVVLRFVTRSDLWLDEVLTVNIARLPFDEMHEALRHDGAPPLYYWMLHGWMSVFGESDVAVRALAGVFSIATLPLAWFAGRRLGRAGPPGPMGDDSSGNRSVAALALLVLAASPFAIRYATEARMYSLVMLLVTAGYLILRRALERPTLLRLALVALVTGALLYTHYWTLYLLAVVGAGLVWRSLRAPAGPERRASRRVVVAVGAGFVALAPWVPTFLYQARHTGTPWGAGRPPWTTMRTALDQFANGAGLFHGANNVLAVVLLVLALLALLGVSAGPRHVDLDLRTRPAVRSEWAAGFFALAFALAVAWLLDGAFDARYASMMFPLFALVVTWGFTVFGSRRILLTAVGLTLALSLWASLYNVRDQRTQAGQVASVIAAEAVPGDLVVYCPDQLGPAVARLVSERRDLRQVTFPRGDRPGLVDWVDYADRVARTDPARFAERVVERAGDRTIWYVANDRYHNVLGKCENLERALRDARSGARERVEGDEDVFFEWGSLIQYPPA